MFEKKKTENKGKMEAAKKEVQRQNKRRKTAYLFLRHFCYHFYLHALW